MVPKMGEAKQIIVFDKQKKLKLKKEELEKILNKENVKELPIVVLSVIGAYRTGKSFLLSWLVRYFKADVKDSEWIKQYENEEKLSQFFKWRSGSEHETQGIWAWSEVFVVNGPLGEKVGVLLIDTQGLFDQTNTVKQNGNIFTLSTLISSIQIFNLRCTMQEDSLANLQLFSEFGRMALSKKNHNSKTMTPFQRIIFLIRDWSNPKERSFGSQGGKDYIDNYLKISKEEEDTELGERRRQVRQLFFKLDCYLMPKPGEKIETDESDSNSSLKDMKENFKDHLGKLPAFLFPNGAVGQAKLVAGKPILASELANFVEYYVNLLNSDDKLSAQSMSQAMTKIHNTAVVKDAIEEYKTYVTAVEKEVKETFLTGLEITIKHSDAEKKALDYFEENQMGEDQSIYAMSSQLKKDINDEYEHWKRRNELAKLKIVESNGTSLKSTKTSYTTSMEDYLKQTNPFANLEQLTKRHQDIQNLMKSYLEKHLKGPKEFTMDYTIQLQEFTQDYFLKVIVPQNKSKEKEEKDRLEKIRLENEREKERAEKEEAQSAAAKAEAERVRVAAETDKLKYEWEKKMELEREKLKQEKIRLEAECRAIRDMMAGEIKNLESGYKMKMELESEKQKTKQAEIEKLRSERELRAKDSQNSTQAWGQILSGALTGLTSVMAAKAPSNSDESSNSQSHPLSYEQSSMRKTSGTSNYRRQYSQYADSDEDDSDKVARSSRPSVASGSKVVRVVSNRVPSKDDYVSHPAFVQAQRDGARANSPPLPRSTKNPTANVPPKGKVSVQASCDGVRTNSPPLSRSTGNPTVNVPPIGKVSFQASRDGARANSPPLPRSTVNPNVKVTQRGNVPVQASRGGARVNNLPPSNPSPEGPGKKE